MLSFSPPPTPEEKNLFFDLSASLVDHSTELLFVLGHLLLEKVLYQTGY